MPSLIISSDFTPTHIVSVKLLEFLFPLDQSCLQSDQQVLLYPITSCIVSITVCVVPHQNAVTEDCAGQPSVLLPPALSGPGSHKDVLPASILTDFGLLQCLHHAGRLFKC